MALTNPSANQSSVPTYFFLNGEIHKRLRVIRGSDQLTAWNFPQGKLMIYSLTAARPNMEPAFTTTQVEKMINRKQITILHAICDGLAEPPQMTYSIDEKRNSYKYMWGEKDIMKLHEYFMTRHRGKARKDGGITPQVLPTRMELKAMINQEVVLYVKNSKGEFVPTFKAEAY